MQHIDLAIVAITPLDPAAPGVRAEDQIEDQFFMLRVDADVQQPGRLEVAHDGKQPRIASIAQVLEFGDLGRESGHGSPRSSRAGIAQPYFSSLALTVSSSKPGLRSTEIGQVSLVF